MRMDHEATRVVANTSYRLTEGGLKLSRGIFFFFPFHFGKAAQTAINSNTFGEKTDNMEPVLYKSWVNTTLYRQSLI